MFEPTNKNVAAEIAPRISSALRYLKLGIMFIFFKALIQKCTVANLHCHYYTFLNKLFILGLIQIFS